MQAAYYLFSRMTGLVELCDCPSFQCDAVQNNNCMPACVRANVVLQDLM
jgi:hypothetical protein